MATNSKQKGKPSAVITSCNALSPPPNKRLAATAPRSSIQKTLCHTEEPTCVGWDKLSITSAAESAEVVRKTSMMIKLSTDVKVDSGKLCKKEKSAIETSAST